MPYSRKTEHTSTSEATHPPPQKSLNPRLTSKIPAKPEKLPGSPPEKRQKNSTETPYGGREPDGQPALLAVESNRSLWELAERRQFAGWRYAPNPDGGKPKKPPINPHTGEHADATAPETWGTFAEAERAVTRYGLAGVGFVFTREDPYAGVDLDDCRNPETGELEPWAERVVKAFDSYAEVSPSGTGVKIICRGQLPESAKHRKDLTGGGRIELYDQAQYFTLTGRALEPGNPIRSAQRKLEALCRKLWPEPEESPTPHGPGPPEPVELEDDELLEQARRARNGWKFASLFDRGEAERYRSESEANMALCGLLAFWTNRDAERMDRLFRRSALMRQKWEQRGDYRQRTVERAIAGCRSGYTPQPETIPEVGEAIRKLKAWAEQEPWTGKGGPTDWKAFGCLLNTGGGYGRARRGGIEVSIAQRDMALAIGQPRSSAKRSLERLEAEHRIKILDTGNAKHSMKILIRYLPESVHIEANPPEPPPVFNMDRFRELLFKFRNPAPLMPDYDRNGRRISPARSELISPLGGLGALIIEKAVLAPAGLTDSQIAERLQRRLDKIKPLLLALLEFGLLVEASGVYRAPADLLERLELELERSGCNAAEERDRRRYETDREARRLFSRERQPEPDGYIEDLEPLERVEASQEPESPGPTPNPVPEQEIAPDALITDASDPDQFRELAHVLRTGLTRLESHRARRSARREARRLDREQGGYERRRDGAHMSPAAFLRSELSGVTAMDYAAMLRRWKAMGGKKETLEGAISAGSYCLKTERMDFNRPYVYPAVSVSRAERGAA